MTITARQRTIAIVTALILFPIILHLRPAYRFHNIIPSFGTNSSVLYSSWTSYHEFVEPGTLDTPDAPEIYDDIPEASKAPEDSVAPESPETPVASEKSDDTFDIIVSLYKEDPDAVAASLAKIQSLPVLEQYSRVRVFVYAKDENAKIEELRAALNLSNVIPMLNRGRETGTFLTHIIENWDDLATQTMFIQAQMHSYEDALNRLSDYLSPKTGVLSLGVHEVCDCMSCTDPWDNQRTFPRLEELYSIINRRFCPPRITLSYLGQIVASKKRIHSHPLRMYQYIKDILESDLSDPIHSDPRQDMFEDSITNPYFGHTMERSYMVLWNCDNPSIVDRCGNGFPALANRRGPNDADDKCQCIDY
jgi:Protein of unknown function (DUF3431)